MKIVLVLFLVLTFIGITTEISSEASFVYMIGTASWYSEFSPGVRPTTANMEKFDHKKMTCAVWGIPFNSIIEVTNIRNGRKVLVRVNDRGPARKYYARGRVIDLTMEAFKEIEDLDRGLARVRLRVIK